MAEITDEGDFLLLANRLYSNRAATAREKELRTEHLGHGHTGGAQSARAVTPGSYMPYGIAEPTPIPSPSTKPVSFLSPVVRPSILGPGTGTSGPPTAASGFGLPGQLRPSAALGVVAATGQEPDAIKDELESFCKDAPALEAFYKETLERTPQPPQPSTAASGSDSASLATPGFGATTATATGAPTPLNGTVSDMNIPVLGLPPGVLSSSSAGSTPGSDRIGINPRVGSPAMLAASQIFRRASVQDGIMGVRIGAGAGVGGNMTGERGGDSRDREAK